MNFVKPGDYMRTIITNRKIKPLVFLACLILEVLLPLNILYAEPVQDQEVRYLISVNRAQNCITIYRGNEAGEFRDAIRSMVCSTAADGVSTPLGTFTLKDKREWGALTDGVYSPYVTRIEGSVFFVGSAYFSVDNSDLDIETYNQLGESVTGNGCIRLTDADAKWIYDYCPAGTQVEIYDDALNAGPLGKPEAIKIPADHEYAGWDPTDPDENNPWKQLEPRIEGIHDIELNVGDEIDLFAGVTAYDTCGNDITSDIILMGEYDLSKPGTYTITYVIVDATGSQVNNSVTVTVYDKEAVTEAATREPVTVVTQKEVDAMRKKNKIISVLTLGFVTFLLAVLLLKWAKRD